MTVPVILLGDGTQRFVGVPNILEVPVPSIFRRPESALPMVLLLIYRVPIKSNGAIALAVSYRIKLPPEDTPKLLLRRYKLNACAVTGSALRPGCLMTS